MINVEVKVLDPRLNEWGPPSYQSAMAAGIDLYACLDKELILRPQEQATLIPTGMAMHMAAENICALILPRSGLGHKKGLVLGNNVGLIDADYTDQCFISAWNRNPPEVDDAEIVIHPGDRIAQMMFVPVVRPNFEVVEEFSLNSERKGGFGSTGGSAHLQAGNE